MQEQLITFETAKLAKEKGFDIRCHWYFTHKRKFPTSEDTYYPSQTSKPQNWNDDSDLKFYERFSAPTQSLLQKWLREVHKIHIIVYCMEKSLEDGWETYFDVHLKQETKMNALQSIVGKAREFNTYEEALEKGLQEALKLIK